MDARLRGNVNYRIRNAKNFFAVLELRAGNDAVMGLPDPLHYVWSCLLFYLLVSCGGLVDERVNISLKLAVDALIIDHFPTVEEAEKLHAYLLPHYRPGDPELDVSARALRYIQAHPPALSNA